MCNKEIANVFVLIISLYLCLKCFMRAFVLYFMRVFVFLYVSRMDFVHVHYVYAGMTIFMYVCMYVCIYVM